MMIHDIDLTFSQVYKRSLLSIFALLPHENSDPWTATQINQSTKTSPKNHSKMEPRWTALEEELLMSLVHSAERGGVCRVVRSWTEISNLMTQRTLELGINERVYTRTSVAYHYARMPKGQGEQNVERAATRMAEADGSNKECPGTLATMGKGSAGWKLPSVSARPHEPSTQATGPPKGFGKYKGQKAKRHEKR
jgi:hypothetical protein